MSYNSNPTSTTEMTECLVSENMAVLMAIASASGVERATEDCLREDQKTATQIRIPEVDLLVKGQLPKSASVYT